MKHFYVLDCSALHTMMEWCVSCPTSSSDSRSSSRRGLRRSDEGGQRADNKGQSSSNEVGVRVGRSLTL